MSLIWWVMACLWEFGVLQHRNETNFGENSFRHFTAYLSTSSAKVIKPIKSFVIRFCGHESVQSSIAFLYFNLTDQNTSQNSHNFSTKIEGLCTFSELSAKTTAPLFLSLIFATFHNESVLFTKWVAYMQSCSIVLETKVEIAPLKI